MNLQQEKPICIEKDKKPSTIMKSLLADVRKSNEFLKDLVTAEEQEVDNVYVSDAEFEKYLLPTVDRKDSGIADVDSDSGVTDCKVSGIIFRYMHWKKRLKISSTIRFLL